MFLQQRQHLETQRLLVILRQHWRSKGFGEEIGAPSSEVKRRSGTNEGQNTGQDFGVEGRILKGQAASLGQALQRRGTGGHGEMMFEQLRVGITLAREPLLSTAGGTAS